MAARLDPPVLDDGTVVVAAPDYRPEWTYRLPCAGCGEIRQVTGRWGQVKPWRCQCGEVSLTTFGRRYHLLER